MHPPLEPFASGTLRRPGGVEVYWETSGNPRGRPALYLHGGPGGGLGRGGYRRRFDPAEYLIVGFDQRGCGKSIPWAIDDLDHLEENNTQSLIDDIEALRTHLGVHAWLVHGVSWGSTLALAYALTHRDRVTEIVLTAVTTGSRAEIDWITEGVGAIFPEAWAELAANVPPGARVVEHYAALLRDPDPAVRAAAADRWDSGKRRTSRSTRTGSPVRLTKIRAPGRTSRRWSRTTGRTTASSTARTPFSAEPRSSPASRVFSSTAATTSADPPSHRGACTVPGRGAASRSWRPKATAANGR